MTSPGPFPPVTIGSSSWLSLESSAFLRRAAAGRFPGSVTSPGLSPSARGAHGGQTTAPNPSTPFGDTPLPSTRKGRSWHCLFSPGTGTWKGRDTGGLGCDSPHSICTKQLCSSSSAAGLITPPTAPGPLHKRCWDKLLGSCSPSMLRDASLLACLSKSQLSQGIPQLCQEHTSPKHPPDIIPSTHAPLQNHTHIKTLLPDPSASLLCQVNYHRPLTPLCSSFSLSREF